MIVFDKEREYLKEIAYIIAQKTIEDQQQWEEEQSKIKPAKITIVYDESIKLGKVHRAAKERILS